ncbi:unnamed protein product [Colias eurytheme]|nr:unnamed protein product [Colias eurytheme]
MTYKKFKAYKYFLGNLGESEAINYSIGTPMCMLNVSSLGSISANKTDLKLKWVEKQYRDIRPGGFYAPADCRARHKVAILVPYRNRATNLAIFLNHMHRFLMKQLLEYRIFVIEQFGTESFNKGSLFNVGFLESQRFGTWRCYVFHDVDLLPLDERIFYSCPRKPTHMSSAVETFKYELPYPQLFGGVTSMTSDQFKAVNGYSNRYTGWGGEDDDMFIRIQASKFPVLRYNKTIGKYAALPHERNNKNRKK